MTDNQGKEPAKYPAIKCSKCNNHVPAFWSDVIGHEMKTIGNKEHKPQLCANCQPPLGKNDMALAMSYINGKHFTDTKELVVGKGGDLSLKEQIIELKIHDPLWTGLHKSKLAIGIIKEQAKQLTTTQQKLDSAVEALKFYANNYRTLSGLNEDGVYTYIEPNEHIQYDEGKTAKAALASISGEEML